MNNESDYPARQAASTQTVQLIDQIRREMAVLYRDSHLDDEGRALRQTAERVYDVWRDAHPGTPLLLACWCKTPAHPETPCHGDIVKNYLEGQA